SQLELLEDGGQRGDESAAQAAGHGLGDEVAADLDEEVGLLERLAVPGHGVDEAVEAAVGLVEMDAQARASELVAELLGERAVLLIVEDAEVDVAPAAAAESRREAVDAQEQEARPADQRGLALGGDGAVV